MQAILEQTRKAESVDDVVNSVQIQLVFVEEAIRHLQDYKSHHDDKNMMKVYKMTANALNQLGQQDNTMRTNEQLAQLWAQTGALLHGTNHHAEHYHCVVSAVSHYKQANKWDNAYEAFRTLYGTVR
jgi:hypothetical protein